MKTLVKLLTTALMLTVIVVPARAERDIKSMKAVNALDLRVINKGWTDTSRDYTRLPAWLEDSVRPTLWERSQCSSGIAVRFATNSTAVGVKYRLLWNTHLPHMADTGLKGTDLYIWEGGEPAFEGDTRWRHVNTNRPSSKKEQMWNDKVYVENMDSIMKEFMIYLPLYDGVEELYVMIDSGS